MRERIKGLRRILSILTVSILVLSTTVPGFALEKKQKIESSEEFISDCVEDETGWFESTEDTGKGLEDFYDETGVQPWVLFKSYDEDLSSDKERENFLEDYYLDNFYADDREDVYLFVYFDNDDGYMGDMYGFAGDEAERIMDEEAEDLLKDYFEELWSGDLSTDDLVIKAFSLTAESVMSGKKVEADSEVKSESSGTDKDSSSAIDEDGSYNSKDEVALYIHTYGKLPSNYISKADAEKLGWSGGSLEPYAPGKSIGGSKFGNYEGILPTKKGRTYTECDIDTAGRSSRGARRIVFSNDGLIYYTEDHYETFELLYGEE